MWVKQRLDKKMRKAIGQNAGHEKLTFNEYN